MVEIILQVFLEVKGWERKTDGTRLLVIPKHLPRLVLQPIAFMEACLRSLRTCLG